LRFAVVREDDLQVARAADADVPDVFYREPMSRIRALLPYLRRYVFDVIIVVFAVGGVLEMLSIPEGAAAEPDTPPRDLWVAIPVALLMTLPLLARRRWPFAAPAFICVVGAVTSYAEPLLIPWAFTPFLGLMASFFLFGMLEDRIQLRAGLGMAAATIVIVGWFDQSTSLDEYVWVSLITGMVWVAGFALKHKLSEAESERERLEREREERAREAVAEERARLARELHDVVGHSVSVMTVQASAVRRLLLPEQEKEREALEVVEQTGRQALAEMRRLVGVLRRPEEAPALAPQPSLEHLDKLVAQVRESGLPVELRVEGEPAPLPAGVDLTAYRLVQEGLTNALKHARADHAEVFVRYGDGEIELEINDNGTGGGDGSGGGHGLVGMRERVAVYGGELDAAARPEGGFRLRARLPLEAT
jgi:signal transduction histidine kinase